jgi:hypothetical protein
MNGGGPVSGSARSVMREIDHELTRLERWEKAAASERRLLLSARAVLAAKAEPGLARRRLSPRDVAAYLAEHPGSWPVDIAEALQGPPDQRLNAPVSRPAQTLRTPRGRLASAPGHRSGAAVSEAPSLR